VTGLLQTVNPDGGGSAAAGAVAGACRTTTVVAGHAGSVDDASTQQSAEHATRRSTGPDCPGAQHRCPSADPEPVEQGQSPGPEASRATIEIAAAPNPRPNTHRSHERLIGFGQIATIVPAIYGPLGRFERTDRVGTRPPRAAAALGVGAARGEGGVRSWTLCPGRVFVPLSRGGSRLARVSASPEGRLGFAVAVAGLQAKSIPAGR
jgi:hypothetical protein